MATKGQNAAATQDQLERLVDEVGLASVLEALAEVCYAKAGHIEENWQDQLLANAWTRAGRRVDSVAYSEAVVAVQP